MTSRRALIDSALSRRDPWRSRADLDRPPRDSCSKRPGSSVVLPRDALTAPTDVYAGLDLDVTLRTEVAERTTRFVACENIIKLMARLLQRIRGGFFSNEMRYINLRFTYFLTSVPLDYASSCRILLNSIATESWILIISLSSYLNIYNGPLHRKTVAPLQRALRRTYR